MQPLLPEDSLCSGMSWVEALQDSFKARSGSRAPQVCLLGLLLWNFLKVISWKPFSPAFTVIPMMHSQLWPSASTGCRRSFLPDVLLSASYLHSSWASCRSHMPQWPSRRNCPQSIHGRVSAHPAIRRKKNTATLKINIFPARKEIFCKFLQYMLSNTFLQHKRLSVPIQQKNPIPVGFPVQQATVLQRPAISVCTSCSRVPAVLVCAAWSAVCAQLLLLHASITSHQQLCMVSRWRERSCNDLIL